MGRRDINQAGQDRTGDKSCVGARQASREEKKERVSESTEIEKG